MKKYILLSDFLGFKAGTEFLLVQPFSRRYSPEGNSEIGLELSPKLMAQHPDIFCEELINPDFSEEDERPQKYFAYCWIRNGKEKKWSISEGRFYTKSDAADYIKELAIRLHIPGEIDFEFPAFPGEKGLYYGPKAEEGDKVSCLDIRDWRRDWRRVKLWTS